MKNKISAIVPTAPWHFERVQILLKSLKKFMDPNAIDILYIIFPDKQKMEKKIKELNIEFNVQVLAEQDIIPETDYNIFSKRKGWYRQQIAKLFISYRIRTPYYICLDADVVCIKTTYYTDLIIDDKPCCNIEPKWVHKRWWKDSQKVLGIKAPDSNTGMTSSTNIFITEEVKNLINHIENRYKKSFIKKLFNWFWVNNYFSIVKWTEYKLYWLYIEYQNKVNLYNLDSPIWSKSLWKSGELDENNFKNVLTSSEKGQFAIIQGNIISDELAKQMTDKYLNI